MGDNWPEPLFFVMPGKMAQGHLGHLLGPLWALRSFQSLCYLHWKLNNSMVVKVAWLLAANLPHSLTKLLLLLLLFLILQ